MYKFIMVVAISIGMYGHIGTASAADFEIVMDSNFLNYDEADIIYMIDYDKRKHVDAARTYVDKSISCPPGPPKSLQEELVGLLRGNPNIKAGEKITVLQIRHDIHQACVGLRFVYMVGDLLRQ